MTSKVFLTLSAILTLAALASPASAQTSQQDRYDPARTEARISKLHQQLQITPAEEPLWNNLANVIKANAQAMRQAYDHRHSRLASLDASENLRLYAESAETHARNMRRFAATFDKLYRAMPPAQKLVADEVFRTRAKRF